MSKHSEAFVVFDSSKLRNAVAIADGGREGEVRFLGEIDSNMAAITQLVRKLEANYERITFCYEAGPTGYELQRHIKALGHECLVVAPSLIPKKPGDRVKTNRRDAVSLVKLLRAGELTAVWVPDRRHEAMRDLTRARETAVIDLRAKRQQVSAFLLRQGRWYPAGKKTWTNAHMNWLASQKFEQPERRIVFEEMMFAIRQAQERVERLEQAIRAAVPDWSLAQGGHRIDGLARHRSDLGDGVAGRARRSLALSNRTRADGISRHGVFREFNRRYDQARSHHQGRQSASATHARGVRLELSASAPYRHRQTGESRGSAAKGARDRLEGAVASQPPLPSAHQERQTQDGRHHRSRA